ncbi:MAG TPA: NAD(P)H-dependent oxidoreductase [Bacteroidia bacterium]|nr:NAD(P)H-dependent oxidoreductase [Bacteroidia bacterium]
MTKKVLILFAHPLYEKSRVHTALVRAIPRIPEVTFHDLYEFYPDFNINIEHEQQLLLQHDIIIWQHPFYWYSVPPMLKQWIDMVLEYGWAYGRGGTKLQDKWVMNVLSAGGPYEAYAADARNRFTVREFLAPLEQTVRLCHMHFLPPFVVHGTHKITTDLIDNQAHRYRNLIEHLVAGTALLDDYQGMEYINQNTKTVTDGR